MDQAGPDTTASARARSRILPKIPLLDGCTAYGHCVVNIVTALRPLSAEGKLVLIRDLLAFLIRQYREISRHQRRRPGGWR
jgi:hypothetical protein